MPQPFYFFRFEFQRPVKLISPLADLRGYGNSNAGWVVVGGGKRMLILNLKMKFFLVKTHSQSQKFTGARTRVSCVNFSFTKSDLSSDVDVQLNQAVHFNVRRVF